MATMFKGILTHKLHSHNLYGPKNQEAIRDLYWLMVQLEDAAMSNCDLTGKELCLMLDTHESLQGKLEFLKMSYECKNQHLGASTNFNLDDSETSMAVSKQVLQINKLMKRTILVHLDILTSSEGSKRRRYNYSRIQELYEVARHIYEELNERKHKQTEDIKARAQLNVNIKNEDEQYARDLHLAIRRIDWCRMGIDDLTESALKKLKDDLQKNNTNWEGSSMLSTDITRGMKAMNVQDKYVDDKRYFANKIAEIFDIKKGVEIIADTIWSVTNNIDFLRKTMFSEDDPDGIGSSSGYAK